MFYGEVASISGAPVFPEKRKKVFPDSSKKEIIEAFPVKRFIV
jgi:hypothetical protein